MSFRKSKLMAMNDTANGFKAADLAAQLALLRATTHRLSVTPAAHLPRCAAQIAATIWNCRTVLSLNTESTKSSSEIATALHRFRTTITNLLQDRSVQGRWAAVVLVKAAIEAGGIDTLSKSNGWIKSLISILKKTDPPSTKRVTIITLTRIFTLTGKHPNLTRELTTPNLPAFVSSCLTNLQRERASPGTIVTILESFATLLPKHPTIFRTVENQLRSGLLQIVLSTSAEGDRSVHYTARHRAIADRLLVSLHHCAPKQSHSEKWHDGLKSAISAAHRTGDVVLKSVVESREYLFALESSTRSASTAPQPRLESLDQLALPAFDGLHAAVDRLIVLLELIQSHLQAATADAVAIEVGQIIGLFTRLMAIVQVTGDDQAIKANPEIPKDERETMFQLLPMIHTSSIDLARTMIVRLGTAATGFIPQVLDNVLHVFARESSETALRAASFEFIQVVLELVGPALTKQTISDLSTIIQACYTELLSAISENGPTSTVGIGTGNLSQSLEASSPHPASSSSYHASYVSNTQNSGKCTLACHNS